MTITQTRPDPTDTGTFGIDHYICAACWPEYIPGRIVIAYCGTRVPDTNIYYQGDDFHNLCPMCATIINTPGACYRCGQ